MTSLERQEKLVPPPPMALEIGQLLRCMNVLAEYEST